MVYSVTDKMNFSAMKTEQFSKRTFLFLKFTFDGVTWKKLWNRYFGQHQNS